MITVSLLEPYWRITFEKELSKLGLKKCKSQDPKYNTFKHGSRRFQFNEDYSWIDVTNLQQALVANKFERMFDDNIFSNYISELNAKKNNTRENLNAIKFSQEFFSIQIHGLISSIHSSVGDAILFTSNKDMVKIDFELYGMNISLRHTTRKKISEIVKIDYMEEPWGANNSFASRNSDGKLL
jgi:hypothetical protein